MEKIVNVWYDPEGVLEKVDAAGAVTGFSIQNISTLKQEPSILARLKADRAA